MKRWSATPAGGRKPCESIENRFRIALRNSPVVLFNQDKQLRYTWVFNPSVNAADDILGKTDAEILRSAKEAARLTAAKRRVLRTGKPARGEIWLALCGKRRCFDYWFEPLRDADGRVIGISAASMDVTESALARQELDELKGQLERRVAERTSELRRAMEDIERTRRQIEASEARYRGLSENTEDIHFQVDARGVVRYVGPQVDRYGWAPAQVVGRDLLEFVAPCDRSRVSAEFAGAVAGNPSVVIQARFLCGDGALRWFEEAATIQRDAEGCFAGMTGVLRDIAERKRIEAQAVEQRRNLRRLAAKLATAQDVEQRRLAQGLHDDVAQLLMAVNLKVGMLRNAQDETERSALLADAQRFLGDASSKVRSLSFELGSSVLHGLGLPAALVELCNGVEKRYGVRVETSGVETVAGIEASLAVVLFKAARELLFNVVKHAGVAEARLALERDDDHVRLSVEDRGKGFAVLPNGTVAGKGDGLGLFEIRERISALGGRMRVESRPGLRTRISLWVPSTK